MLCNARFFTFSQCDLQTTRKHEIQYKITTIYIFLVFLRDTVTKQGGHWDLKKVAVHVLFPPDAVSKDTAMALLRWKSSVCSPPLQENEAIVSNVVELSTDIPEGFGFNKEVTLAISHSAADLKGYEVVVKKLIDKENDEWVDVDKTVDFRSLSGKGCFSLIRYF